MTETLFLALSGTLFALAIGLGWRLLPHDRFQVLASLPLRPVGANRWQGCNLTWYGALLASAVVMGLLFVLTLAASGGVPAAPMLAVLLGLLVLCVPASRLVARVVEKKRHTFTIGGAFFCGLLAALPLILLVNGACARLGRPTLDPWVLLAALAVGGVLGEGLGRLACISFGCCYGRPLDECGPLCRSLLRPVAFCLLRLDPQGGVRGRPGRGPAGTGAGADRGGAHRHRARRYLAVLPGAVPGRLPLLRARQSGLAGLVRTAARGFSRRIHCLRLRADGAVAAIVYAVGLGLLLPIGPTNTVQLDRGLALLSDPVVLMGLQLLWWLLFCASAAARSPG